MTARDLPTTVPALRLDGFHTAIVPEGVDDMAWTIGDSGFEMILSTAVPQIIGESIIGALAPLYGREDGLAEAFAPLGDPSRRTEHPRPCAGADGAE